MHQFAPVFLNHRLVAEVIGMNFIWLRRVELRADSVSRMHRPGLLVKSARSTRLVESR